MSKTGTDREKRDRRGNIWGGDNSEPPVWFNYRKKYARGQK
jgi:hypothetical protein